MPTLWRPKRRSKRPSADGSRCPLSADCVEKVGSWRGRAVVAQRCFAWSPRCVAEMRLIAATPSSPCSLHRRSDFFNRIRPSRSFESGPSRSALRAQRTYARRHRTDGSASHVGRSRSLLTLPRSGHQVVRLCWPRWAGSGLRAAGPVLTWPCCGTCLNPSPRGPSRPARRRSGRAGACPRAGSPQCRPDRDGPGGRATAPARGLAAEHRRR